MPDPNPRPQPETRPKTDDEIRAEAQRLMRDPAMKDLIRRARESRARGKSIRLDDVLKKLNARDAD